MAHIASATASGDRRFYRREISDRFLGPVGDVKVLPVTALAADERKRRDVRPARRPADQVESPQVVLEMEVTG